MKSNFIFFLGIISIISNVSYSFKKRDQINDVLLSFIVPCYNRTKTIPKTIESIYSQPTNFEFEVLCIDDASTDNTYELLLNLSKKYPNFRVLQHSKNLGASEARNTGIHNANGSLIFALDSDNLLAENTIQPLVDLLLQSNCDAASVSSIQYINEKDEPIRFSNYNQTNGFFDLRHIFLGTPSPASSGNYLYTKESFYRAGCYEGEGQETWEFGFRQLITGTKFALLPNSHYIHRTSKDSYWRVLNAKGLNDKHCAETLDRYKEILTSESQEFIKKYKKNTKGFFKDMGKGFLKIKPLEKIEHLFEKYAKQLQIIPPLKKTSKKYLDIAAMGKEQYQDIIINNVVVKEATGQRRDCAGRYNIIKEKVLDKYERPFTMIDLGASQGYYSFRTAHDYPSVCVMIDGNNRTYPHTGDQLLSLCKANNLDNIIFLKKALNVKDVDQLGTCEHFDVILAMNIIHWFGNQWKEMADAILRLGDNIIIETPPEETQFSDSGNKRRKEINEYIMACGGISIGKVKRHTSDAYSTIYWIYKPKTNLLYSSWINNKKIQNHHVESTFTKKNLVSKSTQKTTWLPGINLTTFKMYNGAYPDSKTIAHLLENTTIYQNNNLISNKMILQGKKLTVVSKKAT